MKYSFHLFDVIEAQKSYQLYNQIFLLASSEIPWSFCVLNSELVFLQSKIIQYLLLQPHLREKSKSITSIFWQRSPWFLLYLVCSECRAAAILCKTSEIMLPVPPTTPHTRYPDNNSVSRQTHSDLIWKCAWGLVRWVAILKNSSKNSDYLQLEMKKFLQLIICMKMSCKKIINFKFNMNFTFQRPKTVFFIGFRSILTLF